MRWNNDDLEMRLKHALTEDSCFNDITTKSLGLGKLKVEAVILAKDEGVLAGINFAKEIFKYVDKNIKFKILRKDGQLFKKNTSLAKIKGSAKSILSAERTVLNFISRLSGIATLTRRFVNKIKPYRTKIMDTRKTTPCLRLLEKYAVRLGGGYNHRYDLAEAVLIKDNHLSALKKKFKELSLVSVISKVRKSNRHREIEIEVSNIRQFQEAIESAADIIMLDNMSLGQVKKCVKMRNKINSTIKLEVSGGITLSNVKDFAGLGVDRISIGSLTHSPKAIDVSLEILP